MSREIRITIDDDEIFESMKRRKSALDLSWEEVVKRGLREDPGEQAPPGATGPRGQSGEDWHGGDASESRQRGRDRGHRGERGHGRQGSYGPDRDFGPRGDAHRRGRDWPADPFADDFGERLSRQIKQSVAQSLTGSMEGLAQSLGGDFDEFGGDFAELESAEDAVLGFPFLDADGAAPDHSVPLRVNLRSSPDGLGIDVVAVRKGKDVAGTNRFGDGARSSLVAGLADGESAILELAEGAEHYRVDPVLSWSRAADGTPTVTEVEIGAADVVRDGE